MFFVTGGSGFIGKYVVKKLLENGEEVIVLVREAKKYKLQGCEILVEGNLGDIASWKNELKQYTIETCIHLAWEGIPDYSYEMSKKNLLYGLYVLDLCKEFGIKNLVITGSCWEYQNPKGSISVDHPIDYDKSFPAAKNSLRMMAHAFCKENDIHLNWMRLFYVYGPGQREGSLIPYIIKCFREGKQAELNGVYNKNDFVYVKDVADAIVKVAQTHEYDEILNIGTGYSTQVADIVRMIAETMPQKEAAPIYSNTMKNQVDFYADEEEMRKNYEWSAVIQLKEGIQEMLSAKTSKGRKGH